ncbi:MAG: CHAT domain-containing protein [Elainellaceae cyanobacterium]
MFSSVYIWPIASAQVSFNSAHYISAAPQVLDADERLSAGRASYDQGEFIEAARLFQQAAERYDAQGNSVQRAVSLSNLALAYGQLGRWSEAEDVLETSFSLLSVSSEAPAAAADVLSAQGQLQFAQGQFQQAIETWETARQRYSQVGDGEGAVKARFNQAQALQMLGFYRRSVESLVNLKQTLDEQPDSAIAVSVLRSLGDALRVIGVLGSTDLGSRILLQDLNSTEVLGQAMAMAERLELPQAIAQINLSIGHTLRAQASRAEEGRASLVDQALSSYRDAEQAPLASIRTQAQLAQLSLLIEAQRWQEAQRLVTSLDAQLQSLPNTRAALYQQLEFVDSLIALQQADGANLEPSDAVGEPDLRPQGSLLQGPLTTPTAQPPPLAGIAQRLAQIAQLAEGLGDRRVRAQALGTLGTLYAQDQQPQNAQDLLQQALQLSQVGAPDLAYRWQWRLAQLYVKAGNRQKAIAAYDNTLKTLSGLQGDLATTSPELRFSFRDSIEPIHREYVSLLLASQPSTAELEAARQAIESLQLAELNNFFREACLDASAVQIDRVDQRAAVVYPIVLDERFDVIVSLPQDQTPDQTKATDNVASDSRILLHHTVLPDDGRLDAREAANSLRILAETPPSQVFDAQTQEQEFKRQAQQFYQWMIEPFEAELAARETETLVFVLDSGLRSLPVSALFDGNQFLIEKYTVALTPGLQLLESGDVRGDDIDVLMGGLTESRIVPAGSGGGTRQSFDPLPNVKREIDQISSVVADSQVLFNDAFTKTAIQQNVNTDSARVVHFATHGQFGATQEETYILTWDDVISIDELSALLRSSELDRPDPIELLVLSACETALGDDRSALGLAGIAVRAGARSTLGTLWRVNDESTAQLMAQFYKEWATGTVSKAGALQAAQRALLADPEFRSPYFWSPFVLVGDWR